MYTVLAIKIFFLRLKIQKGVGAAILYCYAKAYSPTQLYKLVIASCCLIKLDYTLPIVYIPCEKKIIISYEAASGGLSLAEKLKGENIF